MPPPVQKSGVTNSTLYTREIVRTVRTDPNDSGIVALIEVPPSSTFQLVSRIVGRSGEDRTLSIWYQSTAGKTDSAGSVSIFDITFIHVVNTMVGDVIISDAPSGVQIQVAGDRLVYWTCAATLYVSQVP